MKKLMRCAICILACVCVCGCEQVIDLTPEEEAVIVNYAAHIISKYNVTGPEGYRFVLERDEPKAAEEDVEEAEPEEEEVPEAQEEASPDLTDLASDIPEAETLPAAEAFAKALGIENCGVIYTGAQFTNIYDTVYPEAGNKLMVLHFAMDNRGETPLDVNVLSVSPVFRASLNGGGSVTADISILPNDLSTYMGTLEPQEQKELVLLFQVPEAADENIGTLEMMLIVGAKTTKIILA